MQFPEKIVMVLIGIRVTSIFLGNNFYFYFIVRPRIYSFLRKALDYRYPGKNPKYKERDKKDVGFIKAKYNERGQLLRQGVVDCSHFNYEVTGTGHTTAPNRYKEVPSEYKGELLYKGNLTIRLCVGMELYSEDLGHTGIVCYEDLGNGYEWCVAQSTSEVITDARAYFADDKHRGPNITSLETFSGNSNWHYYTVPRYMIDR